MNKADYAERLYLKALQTKSPVDAIVNAVPAWALGGDKPQFKEKYVEEWQRQLMVTGPGLKAAGIRTLKKLLPEGDYPGVNQS